MTKKYIFAQDSWVHDAVINVIEENGFRYFAHLAASPEHEWTVKQCGLQARREGRRYLYMVRVKHKRDFPIIGRKA